MKQKIVIKVALNCDKCRSKALKIAAVAKGVNSVSLQGADRDQVEVIGDGVDSVCLANVLRKKFHHASILSVQEVKEKEKEKEKEKSKTVPLYYCHGYQYPPCPISSCQVVYDPYPSSFCTVL